MTDKNLEKKESEDRVGNGSRQPTQRERRQSSSELFLKEICCQEHFIPNPLCVNCVEDFERQKVKIA